MSMLLTFFIFVFSLIWMSKLLQRKATNKRPAPEAKGSWPLIGHLHLLGGPKPPHMVLGEMSDKYGPIFTIKMGMHRALIVSDWKMAKECFTTNDRAFATRPKTLAMEILGYHRAMFGFSPYGSYWRQVRKIATIELLSSQRLEKLRHVRESEVRESLKEMYKFWFQNKNAVSDSKRVLVDMKRWFDDITLNFIFRIIVGKSVGYVNSEEGSVQWKRALKEYLHLAGVFVVSDALPFLRWLDIGGYEKLMKKNIEELDVVVEEWIEEHRAKRNSRVDEEKDFMSILMELLEEQNMVTDRDPHMTIKATCMALILAASDTTAVTLEWVLSLLVNNPIVLKKAHEEVDLRVGKERLVQESDVKNFVYLPAVLKEAQRLYPAAPLSVPHEALEDCTIGEYDIPAGTRLFVNLWKLQRDPNVWLDPDEFQPERFLTTHEEMDVYGQNFELMPFGSGRRMCPGILFALQAMQLTLASLIHAFDFASPNGDPVNMSESIGLTNPKSTPLVVLLNPRLASHLYE